VLSVTTIKVTCPDCGDIDLQPADLELSVTPSWATYTFLCADCGEAVSKPADAEVVDLLSSAGVRTVTIPAEALERRAGAAINYDDVLDFALALRDDSRITRSLGSLGVPAAPRRKRRLRW
jgi:predicted RNA-binding Zn-ribbon protein involved in translation (DUF1610 family)